MKRAAILLSFLSIATGAWAGGPTETDLGTRIPHAKPAEIKDSRYSPEDRGRLALREFARCTFARSPSKVSAALVLDAGELQNAALKSVISDDCLDNGEMSFSTTLLRGALFGEMYRRREAEGSTKWKWPVSQIDFNRIPAKEDADDLKLGYLMLYLTDCVSAKDSASLRAVVMEPVASKKQEAAFAKVIPLLGPCLPQGSKLTLNRTTLEAAFGEYMYRSQVPVVPLTEGKPS